MTQTTQTLRELINKANPELICLECHEGHVPLGERLLNEYGESEIEWGACNYCVDSSRSPAYIPVYAPPELNHLLIALEKKYSCCEYVIGTDGHIAKLVSANESGTSTYEGIGLYVDLTKKPLEQTQEVQEALLALLT